MIQDMHGNEVKFESQNVIKVRKRPIEVSAFKVNVRLLVDTLEGVLWAEPGDYIIRGIKGEYYPCNGEIFEQTYEEI